MQATQSNNLSLFRVFKPTILFQASPLSLVQPVYSTSELITSSPLWNQNYTTRNFSNLATPPPVHSVHTTQLQAMSLCETASTMLSAVCPTARDTTSSQVFKPKLQNFEEFSRRDFCSNVTKVSRKKRFPCPLCDIRCSNNGQLQGHLRIHTGERPYRCSYEGCDRRFARNEELTRHKRIHTGVRPHKCEVCQKAFGRKDHLSKHLKTHLQGSEKKTFACPVLGCGQRYSRSDALTRHQWSAHAVHGKMNNRPRKSSLGPFCTSIAVTGDISRTLQWMQEVLRFLDIQKSLHFLCASTEK